VVVEIEIGHSAVLSVWINFQNRSPTAKSLRYQCVRLRILLSGREIQALNTKFLLKIQKKA